MEQEEVVEEEEEMEVELMVDMKVALI